MNLSWNPVTTTQCGGPTVVVAYLLLAFWIRVWGYDGDNVIYESAPAWDEIYSTPETRLNFEFPNPDPGGVFFFRVESVDGWGQRSDGPQVVCP